MKHEKIIKHISVSLAVIGIMSCIALLFPQVRQILIDIGELIRGRSLDANVWNHLLFSTALIYLCIIAAFLVIFFSKFKIPQVLQEKKPLIFTIIEAALICLFSGMLIFLALSSNDVWLDEAYSLTQIRHSWKDLIRLLTIDVHPPFYFLVLKAVSLVLGDSVAVMKMVSVFPAILMAVIVSLFLKKGFSDRSAVFFLLSCIASESITHYSIEIRMYSWALLFITLMFVSAWYFFKSDKKRWWIVILICALGSAYTHNFAAAGAVFVYLFLLFYAFKIKKDKIIAILILAVFGIAFFLPWLPSLIGQFTRASDNFWIQPLTVKDIIEYIRFVFSTGNHFVTLFLCFLFGFVFVSFFIRKNKTGKHFFFFGGLCCAVLLALTGIFISVAIRPLFTARYLLPMCELVWIFFAIECSEIDNKRITVYLYVVLVSIGIMSFSLSAQKEIKNNRDFNAFYANFTAQMQQDDAFIFILDDTGSLHIVGIMSYLFPDNIYTIDATSYMYETPISGLFFELWGAEYIAYEDNLFNDRTAWIFVIEEKGAITQNNDIVSHEIKGEFFGSYGWDFYLFRLYKRSKQPPAS